MSDLYYLMRAQGPLEDLQVPSRTEVDIEGDVTAIIELSKQERNSNRRGHNRNSGNLTVFGNIQIDMPRSISRQLAIIIRRDSGLILLNAKGRAYLRRYAQIALRKALNLESGFIPLYHENLVSLLKSVECFSITISLPGEFKEFYPQEEDVDWQAVENQPFIEAKFYLMAEESRYEIRLTSQTVSFHESKPNALTGTARLVEQFLLSDVHSSDALEMC